ncbi:SUN domain-containing protein 2-like isoform X2 [Fundulus heteroclitus]|uniref:SUN domain-containing protein 2-like isoform X2 n=1 Tax=Fundulus heteroclitus TaxID=8078 RepID=UPI00165C9418|nr:SUN domain-containing protein 2-like isoform X2 [Fundulus heteroclitus]
MSYGKYMLRRSLRLLLNGYYSSDGVPTVSYKETRVRRRRSRWLLNARTTAVPVEDGSGNENLKNYTLNTLCWIIIIIIIFSLFYGCAYLFSALSSQPSETLVTPTATHMVLTPGCKDLEKLIANQHEVLLRIKKELDYLLPPADLLPNFALQSQGARILHQMTSDTYQSRERCSLCGLAIQRPTVGPTIVIQGKSHLLPGQCWAFAGSQGRLSIALPYKVSISHVTLAHIPKMLSPTGTIPSAPKEFSVYGKNDLVDEESLLGTFLYNEDGDRLQTFKIPDHKMGAFTYITLQVKSNWGHSEYTCLYGFRVHGKLEK